MKKHNYSLQTKSMFTQVSAWSHANGRVNSIPGDSGSV
jgi:hypothetical protein